MNLREILPTLPLVVEASRAELHRLSIKEMLSHGGEKAKIIGLSRLLGESIVKRTVGERVIRSLPVHGKVSDKPIAYGFETVVYGLESAYGKFVLKLFNAPEAAAVQAKRYLGWQNEIRRYLQEQLEPTSIVLTQHPFSKRRHLAVGVQRLIEGKDLFQDVDQARTDELEMFRKRISDMHAETGLVPDLSGIGNVMVDESGVIRMIDAGFPIDPTENDACIHDRLQLLSVDLHTYA